MVSFVALLGLTLLTSTSVVLSVVNVSAPIYVLNATLPPNEYLKDICNDLKANALAAFPVMLDEIPPAMRPAAEKLAMNYWESGAIPEPYYSEIKYYSECIGLSITEIITVNIIYDLTAFCTSIVAVTTDGQILHARNMDFPTILRNDTVTMIFVDADNNTLYEQTTFFGYVGTTSGIKYDAFSITIDERADIYGLTNWIEIGETNFPSGWLPRECLIHDKDFDACVQRLSTEQIQAPIYYIVAGTDGSMNGAVVTRNQTQVNSPDDGAQVWYLKDSKYDWYLLETNYDYWRPAMDDRREHANKMLNEVGQENITLATLYQILSTPPVLAPHTVYTILMQPSNTTYYDVTVRFDTTN